MMAYRAGADIQDTGTVHRHVGLAYGPFWGQGSWVGVARDSEGKPFAPISNTDAHDHTWAMGKGPVWMDMRGVSKEAEEYMRWGFDSEAMHAFFNWLDQEKIEIRKTRFEFVPRELHIMMMARVDSNCGTTVEGLYSTISRLGLGQSSVTGMIAGGAAAEYVSEVKPANLEENRDKISQVKQCYEEIVNREGPQFSDWREGQWAIYQIMNCYALPPHRSESTFMAGYNQLLRIRKKAKQQLKASNQHDLYHCLEVLNLMDFAELAILTANERKESRGAARRMDYPFTNPSLANKILVISQKNGKPTFRWEEPRRITESVNKEV
jgi:succinate dehydrogenase/fumarate reductase flavoprotein subunit